ncbi:MAG: GspH/FimT family pseudopilin [Verrucomicrobiota bacterium]|nr:GspH/FimT family pseudopilin [Verrucomicrobiota bacterium]
MTWLESTHSGTSCARAFTLIELILVMALLIVMAALVAPALANFFRGRTLDSQARELLALTDAGQSRAVSEGVNIVLWVDARQNACGLQEESPPQSGDPKAETVTLDDNVQIAVMDSSSSTTTFDRLPAIRFLPDGSIDESSPQTLRLTDSTGGVLWLAESRNRMSYEIRNSQ